MIEMVGFELVNNGISLSTGSSEEKQQKGEEDKKGIKKV
jgi:hypothetical protein